MTGTIFDFATANKISSDELGLSARPAIEIRAGEIAATASAVEEALLEANAPFFVRGGLVRPFAQKVPANGGATTSVPGIVPVDVAMLVDHAGRVVDFVKFDGRAGDYVPCDLTERVAKVLLSRTGEFNFPPLAGVSTTPTLRPDLTILSDAGYDHRTRLLLIDPLPLPGFASKPTKDDAIAALDLLDALLEDFPFVGPSDHSVALSGLLSVVARGALSVAPLHAITAHMAGTGKSYLVDLAAALILGDRAPVLSIGRTEEEMEKRLASALLAGRPMVSIDNVNGELAGDFLCQAVERPLVAVRPLGVSRIVEIENRATIFATGNNIQIVGDMTRRTLLCRLDAKEERPEIRRFAGNPFATILADRGRYVAAALTIMRAYAVAGSPAQASPLASFEDWSRVVRSALIWLGRADPCDTMTAARDSDPERTKLGAVLTAWRGAAGEGWKLARDMAEKAGLRGAHGSFAHIELRDALMAVAEHRRGGEIDPNRLGRYLRGCESRIVDGLKIVSQMDAHAKVQAWRVESAK